jgi:hypothetical protein
MSQMAEVDGSRGTAARVLLPPKRMARHSDFGGTLWFAARH